MGGWKVDELESSGAGFWLAGRWSSSGIRVSGCLAAAVGWWGQCGALRWVDGCGLVFCIGRARAKGLAPLSLSGWVKNRKRQQPCRTWKAFARAGGNWTEGGGGGRHGREGATSTLGTANAGHMMYPTKYPFSSLLHQSRSLYCGTARIA